MLRTISSYPYITETLPNRTYDDIIETLDDLNERLGAHEDELIVIGGANMVLRGLRRATTDVDILVSEGAFEEMKAIEGAIEKLPPKGALDRGATNTSIWINTDWTKIPISGAVEMGDGYYPISYDAYDGDTLEVIGGHAVVPLDHVWGSKAALQRPKDIPDLMLIADATGRSRTLPAPLYKGPFLDS